MIGWEAIAPVLLKLLGDLARDTTKQGEVLAEWKDGQRSIIPDLQRAALVAKVTSCVSLGTDETRSEYVPEDSVALEDQPYLGQLVTAQIGQRKLVLQVQAHVVGHEDDTWGIGVLERIRARIRRPSSLAILHGVEVAIIEMRPTVDASYRDGGRIISCASMDLVLGAAFTDQDPNPTGWIQYVVYSSHIEDVSGVELPVPPNVVNREVPTIPPTP